MTTKRTPTDDISASLLALDDFDAKTDKAAPAKPRQTYPCGQCAGTGRYQGARVHQPKGHCFACGGRGYFLQAPRDRERNRVRRQERKQSAAEQTRATLNEAFNGLTDWMQANASWCSFAAEMLAQIEKGRGLSERQLESVSRIRANAEQRDRERAQRKAIEAAAREAAQVKIDLAPVRAMFETAKAAGLKKPQFRAQGLTLSLAAETGRNPGAIYVRRGDEYLGKILGTVYRPVQGGEEAAGLLLEIAKDPLEAAIAYGRETGTCACCGRELTDPESVARGIGPVCAGKWGW